jgi:hypothetical protein
LLRVPLPEGAGCESQRLRVRGGRAMRRKRESPVAGAVFSAAGCEVLRLRGRCAGSCACGAGCESQRLRGLGGQGGYSPSPLCVAGRGYLCVRRVRKTQSRWGGGEVVVSVFVCCRTWYRQVKNPPEGCHFPLLGRRGRAGLGSLSLLPIFSPRRRVVRAAGRGANPKDCGCEAVALLGRGANPKDCGGWAVVR